MAKKNLMAQENGQYYATMEAVKQNVDNYMSLVDGVKTRESDFIRLLTVKLEDLLSILRSQEQTFYSYLNITGANDLAGLQRKVDEWNGLGANSLFEQKTVQAVYDMVVATVEEAGLLELINEFLGQRTDWIEEQIKQDPTLQEDIAKLFTQFLEKGRFNSGSGLNAQLEISIKNGKYSVQTKSNTKMSNSMKSKLLSMLQTEYEKNPTINQTAIEKAERLLQNSGSPTDINNSIIDYLSTRVAGTALNYIANEIRKTGKGAYARWANFFVIKGYLGEIYWNACMNYIFGHNASIPLGDVKNQAGKSLSVDMFTKGAGFQIKAWNLKEVSEEEQIFQTHTSKNSIYFGNFLQNRAQILEEEAGKIIARMFGSLSYNKPNVEKNADVTTGSNTEPYSRFYNRSDVEWPSTMDDLALLFRANLGEILGISGAGGVMTNGDVYYNTFWAINNKIIPSSLIIEELLHSVKAVSPTSLVDFSVDLKESKKSPTWDAPVSNFSDLAMANRWKVEYSTCFNITRLLDAAAKKA